MIVDVSASYSGPHRSEADSRCYARKGTRSVPMSMREIHDGVMRLSRRQDEIKNTLEECSNAFREWLGYRPGSIGASNLMTGMRVTGIPVGAPLYVDPVFQNKAVSRGLRSVSCTWTKDGTRRTSTCSIPQAPVERPILGGTRWEREASDRATRLDILRNGFIQACFKSAWLEDERRQPHPYLWFDLIVSFTANVLAHVDVFRKEAQAPACEYGLELEILATNGPSEVPVELKLSGHHEVIGSFLPVILGPYPIGEYDKAINLVARDVFNACGEPLEEILEVDWEALRK